MNKTCEICGGACCEAFFLNVGSLGLTLDVMRWVQLHGTVEPTGTRFEVTCKKLTPEGLCGVEETKPNVCHRFRVGSPMCLEAIRLYRPEKLEKIKESLSNS